MSTFDAGSIESRLILDRSDFSRGLDQAKADADKFSGKDIKVKVAADNTAANRGLTDTQGRADKLGKTTPVIRVKADNASANRDLDATLARATALGRTTATLKVDASKAKDAGSWMASLVAAAAAVTPAFAVAGTGVAAFGALAAPTILKVVKAQQDMAKGAKRAQAEWNALTQAQKGAAANLTHLEASYKRFAGAVEPQALTVFNAALTEADVILPHLVPLAREGGNAVAYLVHALGSVASDAQARQFGRFLGQEIGPDMQAITGLIPPLVHLLESLVTNLNPLAVATLRFAGGLVTALNAVSRISPLLVQAGVAALALYKPIAAIIGLDIAGKFAAATASIKGTIGVATAAATVDKALAAGQTELAAATAGFAVAADGTAVAMGELSAAETGAAGAGGLLASVNPLIWAGIAAAAVGLLAIKLITAKDAAEKFNTAMQNAIQASSLSNLDNTILASMEQTQTRLASSAKAVTAAMKDQQPAVTGIATRFQSNYNPALDRALELNQHYRQGLTDLQREAGLVSGRVADLSKQYGGNTAALALMNEAGITSAQITDKNKENWAQARTEIAAAAAAQRQLALDTGRTTAASNAQGDKLMTVLLPAISKITSAEDALLGVVTGGEQAFIGFEQGIGQAADKLGKGGSGLAGAASTAGASMSGLNQQSLALGSSFYGAVESAQKLTDAVQAQQISSRDLTTVVATEAHQLLAYAGNNDAARASVAALINNALGPGTVSMQNLDKWTGQNSTSMSGFKEIIDKTTVKAGQLAHVLGQELNAMMAQAVVNAHGGQKAFDGFAASVLSGRTQGQVFAQQGTSVVASLLAQSGNAATARKNFEEFAISGLGQSKQAADALWTSLSHQLLVQTAAKAGESKAQFEQFAAQLGQTKTKADQLWTSLHKIPAKTNVSVTETGTGKFTVSQMTSATNPYPGGISGRKASGGRITGPGGPRSDTAGVFALSNDEWVIQASSANRYGHAAMAAVNEGRAVIGHAAGGPVSGGIAPLAGQTTQFHQRFVAQMTAAMETAMTAAMKAAVRKAQAEFTAGNVNYKPGAGVEQWRGVVLKALSLAGASASLANNVLYQMQTECVPVDYQILTRRGWLKHDEVRIGDETIGYNPETGRSEWTRITAVHHYGDSPMVRYGNKYWNAEFTPNHKWLTERVTRRWVTEDSQAGLTCPECGAIGSSRGPGGQYGAPFKSWRAVQIHRARSHGTSGHRERRTETAEVSGGFALKTLDNMTQQDRIVLARKAETSGSLDITTREANLLGWIAGDGWMDNGAFGISQSKRQFFNAIDYACGADPHHRRYAERPGHKQHWLPSTSWRLSKAYSQGLLRRAGHPRNDAVALVLAMSTEQREAWLEALLLAEGCWSDGKIVYYQNAGEVADAIELAVYLSGHRPARGERIRQERIAVQITETAPYVGGPSRRASLSEAETREVWCPTTELGSWTARNDCGVFLTGNSGGNPRAVNKWDSNWRRGTPSVGLLQVIGPTYASYGAKRMGYPAPVAYGVSEQPLANTYAGIRYAQTAYGPSLRSSRGGIGSGKGYARGTDGASAGWALTGEQGPELVRFHGGETVLDAHATSAVLNGGRQFPGYAKGTSPSAATLAGIIAGAPKEGWQKDVSNLKSALRIIANALGVKGLSKSDVNKLKGEQGKDQEELLVATAYLKVLTDARHQITTVTEPKLRKQISTLNALSHLGKLSASEARLLKTLKSALAAQQAKLARINVAISGKPAKAKPKGTGTGASGDGSGDAGGAGAGAGGGTSPPAGHFVGVIPSPPGGADIAGGGTGGVGGTGSTITGIGGYPAAPGLGTGYQITPRGARDDWGGFLGGPDGGEQFASQMERLIAAVKASPAATGGHLGAALDGRARSAYSQAMFSTATPFP